MSGRSTIRHGRFVQQFDWPAAQKRFSDPVWTQLAKAYLDLNGITETTIARKGAVVADPNLSPQGKTARMREYFDADAAPTLRAARQAAQAARTALAQTRAQLSTSTIDKTDIAGAFVRGEIRAWLRGLDPAARNAVATIGASPDIVQAILEAPPVLTGLSEDQRIKVEAHALAGAHPEGVAKMEAIRSALEAVESAERAASLTLQDEAQLSPDDVAAVLGDPTSAEILASRLAPETA